MVAMGTSLSDQAWGRESAVYRVTGVMAVVGGWFFTALAAFTTALVFAFVLYFLKLTAILGLLLLASFLIFSTYRYHLKRQEEGSAIEAFSLEAVTKADAAVETTFEQTGRFLKDISDNLSVSFEAAFSEDLERLRNTRRENQEIQKRTNIIVENIFKTLSLIQRRDMDSTYQYSQTVRVLQSIAESHRDIILRTCEHFENYHTGFINPQKEELRHLKTFLTRLLWNTSIMLMRRKKVDYDYIANQCDKIGNLVAEFDKNQVTRIQKGESTTRLSILFYGIVQNSLNISEQTQNLLSVFRESFDGQTMSNRLRDS
jgi:Ca2+/Na+ antiporter